MRKNNDWVTRVVILGPWIILVLMAFYYKKLSGTPDLDTATFGDSFGAFTAFFSALAFVGVLITIYLQMEELRETREELKKSAIAQAESSKALNQQVLSMKLTSDLEALKAQLRNMKHERAVVAERMIKGLSEKILFLNENELYCRPIIVKKGKGENFIRLINVGQDFKVENIVFKGNGKIQHKAGGVLSIGDVISEFQFDVILPTEEDRVTIFIVGLGVSHKYKLVFFRNSDSEFRWIYELVQLGEFDSNEPNGSGGSFFVGAV